MTIVGKKEFKGSLRKLKTTDPKHPDTWNPNYETLLSNDIYLKEFADEVEEARGETGGLSQRFLNLERTQESLNPDSIDALYSLATHASIQARAANLSIKSLRALAQQELEITLENRGVVTGCTVERSTSAARNLHLMGGICFANGRSYHVYDSDNAASVPANISGGSASVSAYLYLSQSSGEWRLAVTAIGQRLPTGAVELYKITIPAGSTDETDPYLNHVTITSVRREEPGFPKFLDSPARESVTIERLSASDYHVTADVISFDGAPCPADSIVISSRARSGFVIELASAADNVKVRLRVSKLDN